jgi:ribose transport system substrate-binding protein
LQLKSFDQQNWGFLPVQREIHEKAEALEPTLKGKAMRKLYARGLPAIALVLATSAMIAGHSLQSIGADSSGLTPAHEEELKALVGKYLSEPEFVAPGDPIDIRSALKGKLLYSIPVTSANPFTEGIFASVKKLAPTIGFTFKEWENQGSLAEWQRGIAQAITDGAALVDLTGGADPRLLGPQIADAHKAGLKVVDSHASGLTQGISANVDATVGAPYEPTGLLQAAYTALKSNAKAHVLIITSDEITGSPVQTKAIKDALAKYCPNCKVSVANATVVQWATSIPAAVRGALLADPSLDYILPLYDPETPFIVPVLKQLAAPKSVHVVTYAGTPSALDEIAKGDYVRMDVGESNENIGMALIDLEARVLMGRKNLPVDRKIALRIWDSSNVKEAGTPAAYSVGYGDAIRKGYFKLWGMD